MNVIKKFSYAIAIPAMLTFGIAHASTTTINFDDISSPGCCAFLSDGYHGFNWSGGSGGFSWVIGEESINTFSGVEAYSGQNFAWSNGATDLSMSDGLFDFISFWARSGWGSGFTATAHGFNGDTETYTQDFTVSDVYQLITFNFSGVDKITITNQSTNLLIDDINVTAVPEPETYAMLLAGLGLLGFAARRKKLKAA